MSNKNTKPEAITNKNEHDRGETEVQQVAASSQGNVVNLEASSQFDMSTRSKTRRLSASHKRYKEKRTAYRIIHRIEPVPEEQRNERQQASLNWAKSVVENGGSAEQAIKRPDYIVSDEEDELGYGDFDSLETDQAKRQKLEPPTGSNIVVAIVDRGISDGSISPSKWRKTEAALLNSYFGILKEFPGEPPCCRDSGWYEERIKLISCADERSFGLLQTALSRLEKLWPDAHLDAIPADRIPAKPRAVGQIPTEPFESTTIFSLLRLGNPSIKVDNWRIVNVSEPEDCHRTIVISIDNDSIAPLVKANGILNYGFSSIKLQVVISQGFGILQNYGDVVTVKDLAAATF